jgi:sigma-54 specific flagellar transcriptional regulator A
MAERGTFRADLLYRLDVVTIRIPALRERREDIAPIASHFLGMLARRGGPRFELSPEAAECLAAYDWPGNVRELRNVIERAVLLGDGAGVLRVSDLPKHVQAAATRRAIEAIPPSACVPETTRVGAAGSAPAGASSGPWLFGPEGTDFYAELDLFERRMIGRALQLSGGSKREAARLLGVNRTTLLEKLKRKSWNAADLGLEELGAATPTPVTFVSDLDWTVPAAPAGTASARTAEDPGPVETRRPEPSGAMALA